jgi:NADPH-dependent 2,4-dienoyl-CoA reductase/sulfur reductase-like enzyme
MTPRQITIVGASLAGLRAAETLRTQGFDGVLTLIGDEPYPPYDRPPLSKQVLRGDWEPERSFLRSKEGYDQLALDMRLGVKATSLDLRTNRVMLAGGTFASYDRLIIATGARVRSLPAVTPRAGVFTLRSLADAIALREAVRHATHVVIVGAGFIGLEVAASCRTRGLPVTVVEALPVPLAPILGPKLGNMVAALHRDHGVDLRTGVTVADVLGDSRVAGVVLSDESHIDADVVVVGIGVTPNTQWLECSGLTLDNGVVCDSFGEAAPGVYAAGDVARVANEWYNGSPRIEHWTNAVEQAVHAATNLLTNQPARTRFSSVPYFWSDQYDRKFQFVGRAGPHDKMVVVDGSVDDRQLTALYRCGDQFAACLTVNQPRALAAYRRLLAAGASWDTALSSASGVPRDLIT